MVQPSTVVTVQCDSAPSQQTEPVPAFPLPLVLASLEAFGSATEKLSCGWADWSGWSSCSVSCGGAGRAVRSRRESGSGCSGQQEEQRPCQTNLCPVHCRAGQWAVWSACSATCGSARLLLSL